MLQSLTLLTLPIALPQTEPPVLEPPRLEPDGVTLLESGFALRVSDEFEAGALVRAFWSYSDGDLGMDRNGFDFHDIDIWAEMELEGYDFRVSFDASDGTARLEDAYARYVHSETLAVTVGNFTPRATFSTALDPDRLVLNDRTLLGTAFDVWDVGVEVAGTALEKLDWFVSVTNGSNDQADDTLLVVRGEYTLHGEEEMPFQEGNHGVEEPEVKFGATYYSDTRNDEIGFGADMLLYRERWGGHAEFMRFGDGLNRNATLPYLGVLLQNDTAPFTVTGWYDFDERFQAAARFQVSDNAASTDLVTGGLTFYPEDVPVAVTADVSFYSDDTDDGFALQVGLTMGRWRRDR